MILTHTSEFEYLKFLFYYADPNVITALGSVLVLDYDNKEYYGYKEIIKVLFKILKLEFSEKLYNEFDVISQMTTPVNPKKYNTCCLFSTLNYIILVQNMLITGSFKHRQYLTTFKERLEKEKPHIKFDPDFHILEIRSGLITEIREIPELDNLYTEKVRIVHGSEKEGNTVNICSGLRKYFDKNELVNKRYLFILNTNPKQYKTEMSTGMICCTSSEQNENEEDKNSKRIVEPLEVLSMEGSKIQLDGYFPMFSNYNSHPVNIQNSNISKILKYFSVKDHKLKFKDIDVLCGGSNVITKLKEGPMS